ncbi:acyltransferase family protein [Pedobacter sp. GR22-6]|uniref:acyltransferase family protein n=1 Tax=Pedobacter sp. GR22-6 TaxID=3127957 RepID=UPI00307DECF2
MKTQHNYVPALDGLRALAVLLVMMVHFGILGVGWVGVQTFFVLSGYLITTSLIMEKSHTDRILKYLKVFYWRRSLRIFPIYFLYAFAILFFWGASDQWARVFGAVVPILTYSINIYALFPNPVDLNGVGHFWSLAVEEQFYLVWPFLIFYLPIKRLKTLLGLLLIIVPLFRLFLFLFLMEKEQSIARAGEFVNFITFSHLDAFAIGATIVFYRDLSNRLSRNFLRKIFFCALSIVFIAGILNFILISNESSIGLGLISTGGYPWLLLDNLGFVWGYSLLNLFSAIVIFCIVNRSKVFPWLENRYLVYVGKISYGIYLYHVAVLIFINWLKDNGIITNRLISFTIYIGLTLLIASLSYHFFEAYFMKFKKKIKVSDISLSKI